MTRTKRRVVGAALLLATVPLDAANARVQPYQIVRLLSYKTSCVVDKIEDRSAAQGVLRFWAGCENVTFYPEGVAITCADRDDDRSCKVETSVRSLDQLNLLQKNR